MERCVLGATQNQNESFNSTVWQHCLKTEFCSAIMVEIAVNLVISFNSGQVPFAKLQERLEVTVSPLTRQYLSDKDHHMVSASMMKAEAQVKRRLYTWIGWHWRSSKWRRRERSTVLGGFSHRTGRTHLRSSTTTITSSKTIFDRLFSKPPLTEGFH